MGRHKKEINPSEMKKAEQLAFEGHQNGTICEALDWPESWLDDRKDIRKKLTKKRAERKIWLRRLQKKTAENGEHEAATMQIFLGKNELGQSDKLEAEITTKILHIEGLQAIGKD